MGGGQEREREIERLQLEQSFVIRRAHARRLRLRSCSGHGGGAALPAHLISLLSWQVTVAVLLDQFISATAAMDRDEEEARLAEIKYYIYIYIYIYI